jgi:hypothetical protein
MFPGKARRNLPARPKSTVRGIVEALEERVVLSFSTSTVHLNLVIHGAPLPVDPGFHVQPLGGIKPFFGGSPTPVGLFPVDIRTGFGLDNIKFNGITGDGTNQTIAIVDAYDDPAFANTGTAAFAASDLAQFDATFGLPDPPSFTKVNQDGNLSPLPGTDPAGAGNPVGNWEVEEALDIEWAHAMAPKANIVLVEASSDSDPNNFDLFHAVATAAGLKGVSVVSMSWGLDEFNGVNPLPGQPNIPETAVDPNFTTPTGHQGVSFFAATGDSGSPGYYPAYSPNVVAVGGTTLNLSDKDAYLGEVGWSGSGGGISKYEPQQAYQNAVQSTGQRTIPDVAFDADPNSGVAVYDSYDDTDLTGPWIAVGGTSLAAPCWAAMVAVCNQGRVIGGGVTLDGPTQTLPYLYDLSSGDFHDILTGSNGGFKAGPGYDEVTGRGSPIPSLLFPDLASFGTPTQIAIAAQPPANVFVNYTFGVVAVIQDNLGHVDPSYTGSVSIALTSNPGNAMLGGNLTVNAVAGRAVFAGLTLDQIASGYQFTISTNGLPSVTTNPFNITANTSPGSGTFYPVATDAGLRAAINAADSNAFAQNTIVLATGTYVVTDTTLGQIVIQNTSSLTNKTLTIVGEGALNTFIEPGVPNWADRLFEVLGTPVLFEDLTLTGGRSRGGGIVGGTTALGGAMLVDNAGVTLTRVTVSGNGATGAGGHSGALGATAASGGNGGPAGNAHGGGIYVAGGTLTLNNDVFQGNVAHGGIGGAGGTGGDGRHAGHPSEAQSGGAGGNGATGGTAAGGAVYLSTGQVISNNSTFTQNQALGGAGGAGGEGGIGGFDKLGGNGGKGGNAGASTGGAIYVAGGALTLTAGSIDHNQALGGAGGIGGAGGAGGTAFGSSGGSLFGGTGTGFPTGSTAHLPPNPVPPNGGVGGDAGKGADGSGGGLYVTGGSLTLTNVTIQANSASGGQGGQGGIGGAGGVGFGIAPPTTFGLGLSAGLGGSGGLGGNAGSGFGGGLYVTGGAVTLVNSALAGNAGQGGAGGSGGSGGAGAFASGLFTGGSTLAVTVPQTGGNGGDGGNGGAGWGGGAYITGGVVTLINDTVATNSADGGNSGVGGLGGPGENTRAAGLPGANGNAGDASAGALFVSGGALTLDNSTVALNAVAASGTATATGGGVLQTAGTLNATSTLFAGNGSADVLGTITADHSLVQSVPGSGTTINGSNNLLNVDPKLDPLGLQNNGGPTPTVALESASPAIGQGTNLLNLFTDQRGFAPRTGPSGTDIGAFQFSAIADTTPPTASVQAPNVTTATASTLNPYQFTVTFSDDVAVANSSLGGVVVQVVPPSGVGGPITASLVSTVPTGVVDPQGNAQSFTLTFRITPPSGNWITGDNGKYSVVLGGAPVADLAGNPLALGAIGSFTVTITPTPPNAPGTPVLQPASDSGRSNSDNITNVTNPTFNVSKIVPNATLQLFRNGKLVNTLTFTAGGTVTIQDPGPVQPDAVYTYTAQQTDLGGSSPMSGSDLITILTVPPPAPVAPVLDPASDSGARDNITDINQPFFDVTATAPAITTGPANFVQLLRKPDPTGNAAFDPNPADYVIVGQSLGTGQVQDGTPVPLPDGTYDYVTRQMDVAGNVGTLGNRTVVTIVTATPPAPTSLTLDPSTDTGVSNSDDITSPALIKFPLFDMSGVEQGATVKLFRNGVLVNSLVTTPQAPGAPPTFISVQIADQKQPFTDGVDTYKVQQIDQAGNVGVISSPLLVTYDSTPPVAPKAPVLEASSDSGISNSDDITNVTHPVFDIAGVEANATLELLRDGVVVTTINFTPGGTVPIQDNGPGGAGVPSGVHTYQAIQVDVAGNTSPISGSLQVTILTKPPANPPGTPKLEPGSDSGASNSDDITNVTSPIFDVTAVDPNVLVQLLRNGVVVGTRSGTGPIKDPGPVQPDGVYTYTAREEDLAGNIGPASSALSVTIETSAPAPSTPVLDPNSDSGAKGDNITNVTQPYFDITTAEAGATVRLLRENTIVGTRIGPGAIQDTGSGGAGVPSGVWHYQAIQIDLAGNTSPLSGTDTVTIIASAPAPGTPVLEPGSDSGVSHTDGITNVTHPIFDVAPAGATSTVELLRKPLGAPDSAYVVVATHTGPGALTDNGPSNAGVPDGTYLYAAQQIDIAANTSPLSGTTQVTIITSEPAPNAPVLQSSNTNGFTNVNKPTFNLTGVTAVATVQLLRKPAGSPDSAYVVAGSRVGPGTLQDNGPSNSGLADGSYVYAARQSDPAGNTSPTSATTAVTVLTTAPAAPPAPVLEAGSDSGRSNTDGITSVNKPIFDLSAGIATNIAKIELLRKVAGASDATYIVVGTLTNLTSGKITDTTGSKGVVADGSYTYAARLTDLASNVSAIGGTLAVTIDTVAPAAPTIVLSPSSGFATHANITGNPQPIFSGAAERNALVELLDKNHNVIAATIASPANGTYSIQVPLQPFGPLTVNARATDVAGNVGPTTSLTIQIAGIAGDFNGDGKTDTAIYDQTASQFFILLSGGGALTPQFGNPAHTNIPITGDFNGDGKADTAIYDQTTSTFYILMSNSKAIVQQFGNPAHVNVPISGDFDGDGKTDFGIYDQTAGQFFILESGGGALTPKFGNAADTNIPVGGDFDGDGKTDIGIYDQTLGQFFVLLSGGGSLTPKLGNKADRNLPVAGDFDGDGKTDFAIYDQTKSRFSITLSGGGSQTPQFGNPSHTNIPVSGDYDGDGKTDIGIYDQTSSQFLIMLSGGGALTPQFGNPAHTNIPLPSVYVPKSAGRAATRSAIIGAATFDLASTAAALAASPAISSQKSAVVTKSIGATPLLLTSPRARQVAQVEHSRKSGMGPIFE